MDSDDESGRPLEYQPIDINQYTNIGGQYVYVGDVPYDFSSMAARRTDEQPLTEEDHQIMSDLFETLKDEQPPDFEGEVKSSYQDYQRTAKFHDQQQTPTRAQIMRGKKSKNKEGIRNLLLKLNGDSSETAIDQLISEYGSKLEFLNYTVLRDMLDSYTNGDLPRDKDFMTRIRYARLINYISKEYGLKIPYPLY